jgi:hypothetical protein
VVKDLVELHGGRVEARNANPGAVFTVHLGAASEPAGQVASEAVPATTSYRRLDPP